jgi:putative tricarboxylic transport membrane protein
MEAFLTGLGAAFAPQILLLVVAGTLLGIVVGALPGISGSTTTALLLPLTITMSPTAAVAFLGSIYCAANYGGSITAILINTTRRPVRLGHGIRRLPPWPVAARPAARSACRRSRAPSAGSSAWWC